MIESFHAVNGKGCSLHKVLVVYTYLCCVLFSMMVNKPVGSAWCNWNEPAVLNRSRIQAKPKAGLVAGILAAGLTNFLRVPTEITDLVQVLYELRREGPLYVFPLRSCADVCLLEHGLPSSVRYTQPTW